MKIMIDGLVREMTVEEVEEYNARQKLYPEPMESPEQRITDLESQLAALTEGYAEGVNQA